MLQQSQAQHEQAQNAVTTLEPLINQRGARAAAIETARYNLGNGYLVTGRYREAIVQFEEVLRLDPGYAAARRNLEIAKSRL